MPVTLIIFGKISQLALFFFLRFKMAELMEKALKDWLPPQKMFDDFGGEKTGSSQENR